MYLFQGMVILITVINSTVLQFTQPTCCISFIAKVHNNYTTDNGVIFAKLNVPYIGYIHVHVY